MEDKKIKGTAYSEDKEIKERIEWIKEWLNVLKQDLAKLNDYRDRWTDFDDGVIYKYSKGWRWINLRQAS